MAKAVHQHRTSIVNQLVVTTPTEGSSISGLSSLITCSLAALASVHVHTLVLSGSGWSLTSLTDTRWTEDTPSSSLLLLLLEISKSVSDHYSNMVYNFKVEIPLVNN